MTTKRIILVVLATGVLAGACVTVAAGDDSTSGRATAQAAPTVDASTAFAVFRRPPRPGDEMPPADRRILSVVAERESVSLDDARAVAPSAGRAVWAMPGRENVCLAIPDPVDGYGISCASGSLALEGRLWVVLVGGTGQRVGDARVAQLVPDQVETVTSVAADGARGSIAVSDNVAFADLEDASRLEFASANAVRSVTIGRTLPEMVAAG